MTSPASVIAGLSEAQKRWFARHFIRIGNPTVHVPTLHPMALNVTWAALTKKGIIEHGRFGKQLTPLGLEVRDLLKGSQ